MPSTQDSYGAQTAAIDPRTSAVGDGPAFLAFYAPALDPVAARLEAAGVSYRRNPGYIDITDGHALDYIFFGGRNRSPTGRPEHFAHANGARRSSACVSPTTICHRSGRCSKPWE